MDRLIVQPYLFMSMVQTGWSAGKPALLDVMSGLLHLYAVTDDVYV